MSTIWRCSVFSIWKLEKLRIHPVKQHVLSNDVQFHLQSQKFMVFPGTKSRKQSPVRDNKRQRKLQTQITSYILFGLAIILLAVIVKLTFPYPLRASCLVKWQFAEPCDLVVSRLQREIKVENEMKEIAVDGDYYTTKTLRLSFTTNTDDDVNIVFVDSPECTCTALAESKAKSWYTLFDAGRNYCNLHVLIGRSGYDFDNFFEVTENAVCTQYDMAHCS